MKILVIGAAGFIGRAVCEVLSQDHEVFAADRGSISGIKNGYTVDLLKPETIKTLLADIQPEAVVNCAGVVDATQNIDLNEIFTRNLLESIAASGVKVRRVIVLGSAGEYGVVDPKNIPVKETTPLRASGGYGLSKVKEVAAAKELAEKYDLPVTIARLFNPIGVGMHPRMLTSAVLRQIEEIKGGEREAIEVGRLDLTRDLIAVKDVALAIKTLVEHEGLRHNVYNVGSGERTTIKHLVELLVRASGLQPMPELKETMPEPEPLVAVQADISRLKADCNWQPQISLEDAIKDMVNAK